MKNTFGSALCLTIFGESHGAGVGAVLDGMAAGVPVDPAALAAAVRALPDLGQTADLDAIRTAALAAFGPEDNYRRLMEIYRAVLDGTPAP